MPIDPELTKALIQDLEDAWNKLQKQKPPETVYAFGIYTTESAEYLIPFACGTKGLAKVAKKYVKTGHYTADEAEDALRWSIPDSPYLDALKYGRTEAALKARPQMFGEEMTDTEAVREIRLRLNSATAALKSLDKQGLFGKGKARESIVLLIEAGDREEAFAEKWAKKLNPQKVYDAWAALGETETVGMWSQYGTKNTYETGQLSLSHDGSLMAVAGDCHAFIFETDTPKQVFSKELPERGAYASITGVSLSHDGTQLAVLSDEGKSFHLSLLSGTKWKMMIQHKFKLKAEELCFTASPRGEWFAIATQDNKITILSADGKTLRCLARNKTWPRRIDTDRDGRLLASVDEESGLHIWDTKDWSEKIHLPEMTGTHTTFSPVGDRLAVTHRWADQDVPIRIINPKTGKLVKQIDLPGYEVQAVAFSPGGEHIACAIQRIEDILDTQVILMEIKSGKTIDRLKGSHESVDDLAFVTNQNAIAIAGNGLGSSLKPLVLWELAASL